MNGLLWSRGHGFEPDQFSVASSFLIKTDFNQKYKCNWSESDQQTKVPFTNEAGLPKNLLPHQIDKKMLT